MSQVILIVIGVGIGALVVLVVWVLVSRRGQTRLRAGLRRGKKVVAGICAAALDQTARKNANKEKALEFIKNKDEASNEEIRAYLKVSRRTAVRYLDALEAEGKVEQVGDIGRGVMYRLK